MKAFKEIGFVKALKYLLFSPLLILFDFLTYSPLRVIFLRMMGAKIGKHVVVGKLWLVNVYRMGFKALNIKDYCVLDDYVLLDLANSITLDEHVTLAWGVSLITHRNVGYKDHPLQGHFPTSNGPIHIRKGCFIGAHSTILDGVNLGEGVCVAAHSLVTRSFESWILVAGIPAKIIKNLKPTDA